MIPFYRKIRKKMADDNRPLKYMRYAIGEIILVVIGILIALQINNWNENRKTKLRSQVYINEIVNDLIHQHLNFDRVIQLYEYIEKRGTRIKEKSKETILILQTEDT